MDFSTQFIEYTQTGYFSKMVADYLSGNEVLRGFYEYPVSIDGIKAAIEKRKNFNTDRGLLVDILNKQYATIPLTEKQQSNIVQLSDANTFTICTAHQPNIFTGHLYFIYKILHTIRLADELSAQLPQYKFVPVYYMGSEDADLDELGHVYINGEKQEWKTKQTGAVGRMKVDGALMKLIGQIEGQLLVHPFGKEIIGLMKGCYKEGTTIEQATLQLVNALFADYGLIILLPDNERLKRSFIPVVEKELKEAFSHKAVEVTTAKFPKDYKAQASGRELNLFYLKDDTRERIESIHSQFTIHNSPLKFDEAGILNELKNHPERFSPNVILRPVFQEMVLPNIAFIGGGGELAYWLELKKVFEAVGVPYPMLLLRNSFAIISKEATQLMKKFRLSAADIFKTEAILINELVKRDSILQLTLDKEKKSICTVYQEIKAVVKPIDVTLQQHVQSLHLQSIKKLEALEKKMQRAEKKKFEAQQRQLHKLKTQLFPNNNLQERVDNIMPWYAQFGSGFIKMLYENSLSLEQKFVVLSEE